MRPLRTWRAVVVLVAGSVCSPAAASAAELWTAQDGGSSLELRAFYKSLGAGLRMQDGVVEIGRALDAVVAEARAALPPEQAALLPDSATVPVWGGLEAHAGRIWGRLLLRERLELEAGWQLGMIIASDPALAGTSVLGSSAPAAPSERPSRRLLDFDPTLADRGGLLLTHNLDLLAVKVRASFADLVVGRQVLSWGSGRLWNPTDLLSPFGPAEIDREVRHGVDAVRASIPLAATAQLELLWLPQLEARDQGGVGRVLFNALGFDIGPSIAKYGRDVVAGVDTAGDLGPLGVHGELAATRALDLGPDGSRDQFLRAVAGADWRLTDRLVLTGEYYFNGWGAADPSGYLDVLRSARVARGEVFGAARHYLGLVAAWKASELVTAQAITIANVTDPSVLLVPAVEYWAEQSLLLRVNASIPLGRQPDPSGLRRLTLADATLQTDDWRRATRSLGWRSEFGASPWCLFAQMAVYFP